MAAGVLAATAPVLAADLLPVALIGLLATRCTPWSSVTAARGSGLRGIERRLGTFDGVLAVSSPPGGPTIIVIEVPCALSSPKISSC